MSCRNVFSKVRVIGKCQGLGVAGDRAVLRGVTPGGKDQGISSWNWQPHLLWASGKVITITPHRVVIKMK